MSVTDLRQTKSITNFSGEISCNMRMMKMNSESKSLMPRAKSFSLDTRSIDRISRDNSKMFQDSESLKLSITKNRREEPCRSQMGNQTDTQTMSDTLDPDDGDVPHHISHSTSDTVLLDLNENKAKMGKLMREISDKIPSNDGTYLTCMTSVTTFSQKQDFLQDFSPGKMSKFINSPSSLDVQRLSVAPWPLYMRFRLGL